MIVLLRHVFAIAVLPFTVAVLVPVWIMRRYAIAPAVAGTSGGLVLQAAGVGTAAIGLVLFSSCLRRFASEGKGTLAPWDPPRALVVSGPYRYVRNPMISGVLFVLIAEALVLRSPPHAVWAAAFLVLNALYIPALEEPLLNARFGQDYREYCRHVPRFLPRLRPWTATPPP